MRTRQPLPILPGIALLALLALLAPLACHHRGGVAADGPPPRFPRAPASPAFWDAWSDGKAELVSYRLTTPRYGAPRDGVTVLVYVLEEHDDRTWLKNDRADVPEEHRAVVMKLNHMTNFQTGIYPYSVMTSVFAPVGGIGRERFAPTRLVLTSQEWCGQVWHRVLPREDGFSSQIRSYFSVEGEAETFVETAPYPLFEDALLIQLREPDGPFLAAKDGDVWEGAVVPTLWARRTSHEPLAACPASIERRAATRPDGTPVTRFTLRYDDYERTYDVETAPPRRILGWTTSRGERAELVASDRQKYWMLNGVGDERYREELGLDPTLPRVLPNR